MPGSCCYACADSGGRRLGLSGRIAARFQATEITPLLALVGLLLGLFAIMVTPREEEPQINVIFAEVFIPFPGASASEVEYLIAGPAEQVPSEIKGVKHIYTVGAFEQVVRVVLDPQALAAHGIDLGDLRRSLQTGNSIRDDIGVVADNTEALVQAGTFLTQPDQIRGLAVGLRGGQPAYPRRWRRSCNHPTCAARWERRLSAGSRRARLDAGRAASGRRHACKLLLRR